MHKNMNVYFLKLLKFAFKINKHGYENNKLGFKFWNNSIGFNE